MFVTLNITQKVIEYQNTPHPISPKELKMRRRDDKWSDYIMNKMWIQKPH